ncbi:MAG: FaeA/PapI family transcriptional regulator, partial [Aeromonas hydrophila]
MRVCEYSCPPIVANHQGEPAHGVGICGQPSGGCMTTAKQQRTDCMRRDIVAFLATCPAPATTAEVGKALNISVYTARY